MNRNTDIISQENKERIKQLPKNLVRTIVAIYSAFLNTIEASKITEQEDWDRLIKNGHDKVVGVADEMIKKWTREELEWYVKQDLLHTQHQRILGQMMETITNGGGGEEVYAYLKKVRDKMELSLEIISEDSKEDGSLT